MNGPNPSNRKKVWTPAPGGRPNTVGLHERELGDLLDRFDMPEAGKLNPKRDFVRWAFRHTSVQIKLTHPGGAVSTIQVACRNISRGGLSALHCAYLHPGTRCRITLPLPGRAERQVEGVIARCTHRLGMIHEIGIAFEEPIDVREFIEADPLADRFALEKVAVEDLKGTIVYVDESEIDRRIFKHFLRDTPLKLTVTGDPDEALAIIDDQVDLVIADLAVVRERNFISAVHERAPVPVIVASSDTSAEVRPLLARIPAAAFLAKPLTQKLLVRAIAEFLIIRKGGKTTGKAGAASVASDVAPQLVQSFLASLPDYAVRLQGGAKAGDASLCRNLCLQISGTAPVVGFKPLGRLAATAAQMLSKTGDVAKSLSSVRSLIAACERTGISKAA